MITGIYRITNPKGKIYIGQSINIQQRFASYRKTRSNNTGPKLLHSLKKYGYDNHIFEILEQCSIDQLNDREVHWKIFYNSVLQGLNCELYDNSTGPKSILTKLKISQTLKARDRSEDVDHRKAVIQCDISGIPLREWLSGSEAAKSLGYCGSAISECCHKKRKIYKGFLWKFK